VHNVKKNLYNIYILYIITENYRLLRIYFSSVIAGTAGMTGFLSNCYRITQNFLLSYILHSIYSFFIGKKTMNIG